MDHGKALLQCIPAGGGDAGAEWLRDAFHRLLQIRRPHVGSRNIDHVPHQRGCTGQMQGRFNTGDVLGQKDLGTR